MSNFKVALLGASGGVGQALAMLLKLNPMIAELAVYDVKKAPTPCAGVAADVSHINTPTQVKGYTGDEELEAALVGAHCVVITSGKAQKPGMTRDDLFNVNAEIIKSLADACVQHCPKAIILIISNPVNSNVPIVAEQFKKKDCYDWRRILGVTTLDCMRASTFVAEKAGVDARTMKVPVIGGHAGETIMPVLSQTDPPTNFDSSLSETLDKRIQNAGTEVLDAKAGAGSATLCMAYAASKFTDDVLNGLSGVTRTACCYVGNQEAETGLEFISFPCVLGPQGVERVETISNLNSFEQKRFEEVKVKLAHDIKVGKDFVRM